MMPGVEISKRLVLVNTASGVLARTMNVSIVLRLHQYLLRRFALAAYAKEDDRGATPDSWSALGLCSLAGVMSMTVEPGAKVSIVVLVHNALWYVRECLQTLQRTQGVDREIIVVDNASGWVTRAYLTLAAAAGRVDRLLLLNENRLYAGGNNTGALLAADDSTHLLLLNSDVRINSPAWLSVLLRCHTKGASAFGYVPDPPSRADGYCFLIDKGLFLKYRLDEDFPWWWSLTKLQAQLLRDGWCVQVIEEHESYLHHYGGKSKVAEHVLSESRKTDRRQIVEWFGDHRVKRIEHIE
jgi:hypothetical protein